MTGRRSATWTFTLAATMSLALLAALSLPAQAQEQRQLPSEKQWREDVAAAMKGSKAYLDRTATSSRTKYAINLDIDNTSIASHYRPGTAVPEVLSFARYAHQHGIAVMFNTGRTGASLESSRAQLTRVGYHVTQVCGRKSGEKVIDSKQRCRARFIDQGFTIIANVGNRDTDFAGTKNYGRAFKLPDYDNQLP
jgi:predicted secreted acid phosphatase